MLKRAFITIIAFIALLIFSGAFLLYSRQLPSIVNRFLPQDWQLEFPQGGLQTTLSHTTLPAFSLRYQQCTLIEGKQTSLSWQGTPELHIGEATLDYQCLTSLPASDSKTSFSLAPLWAVISPFKADIDALHWKNTPTSWHPRVQQLVNTPSQIHLEASTPNLQLQLQQQAVKIEAEFANQHLSGTVHYQPDSAETHSASFSAELDGQNLFSLPEQLEMSYQWKLPSTLVENPYLKDGSSMLYWQKDDQQNLIGNLDFVSDKQPKNTLNFPLKFDGKTLYVQQGQFFWDWLSDFPLKGYLTAQFTPSDFANGKLFPIKTSLSANLLSQSKAMGNGNIELTAVNGELNADSLRLPFSIDGDVKYQNFALSGSLPADFEGDFADLHLQFKPNAQLHLKGDERFLNVKDLRLLLDNIIVNRFGIHGDLVAQFQGESPDFKNINLKLDGKAKNFKLGLGSFFADPKGKNVANDRWQWQLQGDTELHSLKSRLALKGNGHWQGNLVKIDTLSGNIEQIKTKNLKLEKVDLTLIKPIEFAYEQWKLNGGMQIKSPLLEFSYRGRFKAPNIVLNMNGEIEKLNLSGTIRTAEMAPVKLIAHRELTKNSSRFIGQLIWQEQPATILQPLSPFSRDWIITDGSLTGETQFSVGGGEGLVATGAFNVKRGSISVPKGEIRGITFNFPYLLKNGELEFGLKKPIDLHIDEWDTGIPLQNIQAKVSGHIPHSVTKPLMLKQLSMELLGGTMKVEQFQLPQTQLAHLHLDNIDSTELLSSMQYSQVDLRGHFNAVLPFYFEGNPCYVCDGYISQTGESHLKFTKELISAISKSSGYTERILLRLLNDTEITDLKSLVNVGPKGDMVLDAKLKLELMDQETAKINFNYNHRENIFSLWHMINAGSYVEQNVENTLYQKLDKSKK